MLSVFVPVFMKLTRRNTLYGGSLIALSMLAGCLDGDDGDEVEPTDDEESSAGGDDGDTGETEPGEDDDARDEGEPDETDPVDEAACEAGAALIKAVATGEYDDALALAPTDYFDAREDLEYDAIAKPEGVHVGDCEARSADGMAEFLREEIDADVGEAAILEYSLELEADGRTYDSQLEVSVVEIDSEWYAWFYDELFPRPHAVVTIDGDRTDSVSLTLEDVVADGNAASADGVYVRGDSITDPSEYVLEDVGDSLTVAADSEGAGGYDVVAYIGDSPDDNYAETEIDDFSVIEIDEEAWEDVHEIELEGPISGWVGVSPEQIEGITNPPLYLVEGREYEITWISPGGAHHNIMLVDENDDVVDDYETEIISGEGESQTLTFTATPEISQYICLFHPHSKRGDVKFL